MHTQLYLIANPHSGTKFTTIETVKECLEQSGLSYRLETANTPEEAYRLAREADRNAYRALAVFGGDGTVVPVIRAAIEKDMKVLILPGGSGNVIAKTAGVSMDIAQIIRAFGSGTCITRQVPVASTPLGPLVVDLHFELYTTSRRIKQWLGNKAYYVSAVTRGVRAGRKRFVFNIDGVRVEREGYALFVANMGRFMIGGVNVLPSYRAGQVRVMLVNTKNPVLVSWWWLVRRLTGRHVSSAFSVWRAREVEILEGPRRAFYDDQRIALTPPVTIKAEAHEAQIIVPLVYRRGLGRIWRRLQIWLYREADHLRRQVSGVPSERFSRISNAIYLGGQYGRRGIGSFRQRGITGIISMRRYVPKEVARDLNISILHLPTSDMTAPSLENLDRGVRFIQEQVSAGGKVYVHCHKGEGRGPSMVAAYLISLGMSVEEAVAYIGYYRPFIRPNRQQMRRLYEFAEHLAASSSAR